LHQCQQNEQQIIEHKMTTQYAGVNTVPGLGQEHMVDGFKPSYNIIASPTAVQI